MLLQQSQQAQSMICLYELSQTHTPTYLGTLLRSPHAHLDLSSCVTSLFWCRFVVTSGGGGAVIATCGVCICDCLPCAGSPWTQATQTFLPLLPPSAVFWTLKCVVVPKLPSLPPSDSLAVPSPSSACVRSSTSEYLRHQQQHLVSGPECLLTTPRLLPCLLTHFPP